MLQDDYHSKKMLKHLPVFEEFRRAAVNNAPTYKHPAHTQKPRWKPPVQDGMRVLNVVLAREDDVLVARDAPTLLVLCELFLPCWVRWTTVLRHHDAWQSISVLNNCQSRQSYSRRMTWRFYKRTFKCTKT